MSFFRRAGALVGKVIASASDPAAEASAVQIYSKTVSGVTQFFARASDGTITQITGLVHAYLDAIQTFTQAQTFSQPQTLSAASDPTAAASTVKVYGKVVSGVTQLFARASDGAISQLTGLVAGAFAYLDVAQTFTKNQRVATVALSNASSPVPVDASLSNTFTLTLTSNLQLGTPTNLVDGGTYVFRIKQDGVGGRTLTFTSAWKFSGGGDPVITAAANALDIITATTDGTSMFCSYVADVK